jgi:Uma2 family endonuclease
MTKTAAKKRVARSLSRANQRSQRVPLLYPGDHLSQPEFHRRYEAYPDDTRFELIGGIVYMMAPAGFDHGKSGYDIITILGMYEAATPGVLGASGPTIILGPDSEPEPDVVLMIDPDCGGRTRLKQIKHKHYIEGPPELVVEVSHSTTSIDLHSKRRDYQRAGVLEYIVVCLGDRCVRWFDLENDRERSLDESGVLKCTTFPGLWLDTRALLERDPSRLVATVKKGLKTAEHREFVKRLAAERRRRSTPTRQQRGKTTRNGKNGHHA